MESLTEGVKAIWRNLFSLRIKHNDTKGEKRALGGGRTNTKSFPGDVQRGWPIGGQVRWEPEKGMTKWEGITEGKK